MCSKTQSDPTQTDNTETTNVDNEPISFDWKLLVKTVSNLFFLQPCSGQFCIPFTLLVTETDLASETVCLSQNHVELHHRISKALTSYEMKATT